MFLTIYGVEKCSVTAANIFSQDKYNISECNQQKEPFEKARSKLFGGLQNRCQQSSSAGPVRGEESKCTEPSKRREGGKKIIKITQVKGFERSVMRGFQESR